MKKTIKLLLVMAIVLCATILGGSVYAANYTGQTATRPNLTGTAPNETFTITNVAEFLWLSAEATGIHATAADLNGRTITFAISDGVIDMKDYTSWVPIGGTTGLTNVNINGNGIVIKNLSITNTVVVGGVTLIGFIGNIQTTVAGQSSTIQNITFEAIQVSKSGLFDVTAGTALARYYSSYGAVATPSNLTLSNIKITDTVNANGMITNKSSVTITSATGLSVSNVGGFVGLVQIKSNTNANGSNTKLILITDCSTTANVVNTSTKKDSGNSTGGFVGYIGETSTYNCPLRTSNCYSTGNVTACTQNVAGFIGTNGTNSYIYNSFATGDVYSDSSIANSATGGFVGLSQSSGTIDNGIFNCYATGNVSGGNGSVLNSLVGGFVAYCSQRDFIVNSFSTGTVSCNNSAGYKFVGGFAGWLSPAATGNGVQVINCYSTSKVYPISGGYRGSFVGKLQGNGTFNAVIRNCYATDDGNLYGSSSSTPYLTTDSSTKTFEGMRASGAGTVLETLSNNATPATMITLLPSGYTKLVDGVTYPAVNGVIISNPTWVQSNTQNNGTPYFTLRVAGVDYNPATKLIVDSINTDAVYDSYITSGSKIKASEIVTTTGSRPAGSILLLALYNSTNDLLGVVQSSPITASDKYAVTTEITAPAGLHHAKVLFWNGFTAITQNRSFSQIAAQ